MLYTGRLGWVAIETDRHMISDRHKLGRALVVLTLSLAGAGLQAWPASSSGLTDLFSDAPLVVAVKKGSLEDTQTALVDGATANMRAADGTPVILIATKLPSLDIVKALIEAGARADEKAKDESSALTVAAANGDTEIVSYLLDHGADVDETGSLRETALIKAARARNNAVIKVLIAHKADVTATDATGATALEIAQRSGWTDTVDLLKKAGTK